MLVDEMMQSAHLYVILHDLSSTKKLPFLAVLT